MKIVHAISGLNAGGAEMMLHKLISGWGHNNGEVEVVSLTDKGVIGPRIEELGITVRALGMRRGTPSIAGLLRLSKWLRASRPALVQTWMYHADLLGGLAARFAGSVPVVWGVRNGVLERPGNKRSTIWTAKTCARLSKWLPRQIVCCSESAREFHEGMGYRADKMVVIPNGFDLDTFKPDVEARRSVRLELRLREDALLIGLIARFDPQKDHRNFVEAANLLLAKHPDADFILCGDGVDWNNASLARWIETQKTRERFHLLGRRDDISRIMAALDILVSSSYGEAFPNVVGEAMACGVPCVVTDVGDSAMIVGDTGVVVPARNPAALAEGCLKMINAGKSDRERLGRVARQRVRENFDLAVIRDRYAVLYREVATNRL